MSLSRRNWLKRSVGAVIAPTMLSLGVARAYEIDEVERRLAAPSGVKGVSKLDLPTPSLVLDIEALDGNVARMAAHAKQASVDLRPHAKTHKTPEIARRQLSAGAIGVCAATIREAEAMNAAGIGGILITGELVGPNKIGRLVRLTKKAPETMSVVDNSSHAAQLSEAAQAASVTLNIMIDIDPRGRRTGIAPGAGAVELAKIVDRLPGLRLRGVHGYSGSSAHVIGYDQRREHSIKYMTPVLASFEAMNKAGLPAEIMSGASTGTYNIDTALKGMTELQVGSYAFMDVEYRRVGGRSGDVYTDFQPSLTVLATVMSKNYDDIATIDAGLKAFATDRTFGPEPLIEGVTYSFNGDEHGRLHLENAAREVKLGDKVELIIPHCDPNVNLYDRMYVCRGDQVQAVWKIAARGHI